MNSIVDEIDTIAATPSGSLGPPEDREPGALDPDQRTIVHALRRARMILFVGLSTGRTDVGYVHREVDRKRRSSSFRELAGEPYEYSHA